jgi:L-rhamnose mutarotase
MTVRQKHCSRSFDFDVWKYLIENNAYGEQEKLMPTGMRCKHNRRWWKLMAKVIAAAGKTGSWWYNNAYPLLKRNCKGW